MATGGKVTDAPLDATPLDQATTARINAAGATASMAADTKNTAADASIVLGIEFLDPNYGGASLTITNSHQCLDGTTSYLNEFPAGWNDQISSYQVFNKCLPTHYVDMNRTGDYLEWYAEEPLASLYQYDNQISSVSFATGPTRKNLLDLCDNGSDSCDFHPETGLNESYRDYHEVARIYNCSPSPQTRTLAWADTTAGSITLTTEVSVTAGFSVQALAKLEATVKQTFAKQWSWASTFTDTSAVAVGAWSWAALDRNPKLQSVGGYYELHFGSRRWGHYIWYVRDFIGTGPVPQDAGVTRVRGNVMTDAERAANCSTTRAAAKDAPVKSVATTHSIVPSNPGPAAVTALKPVFAD
jgi:hypothetical protein